MFFAILGESQANLREDELKTRKQNADIGRPPETEYGVLTEAYALAGRALTATPFIRRFINNETETNDDAHSAEAPEAISAVDRIEARQLDLASKIDRLISDEDRLLNAAPKPSTAVPDMQEALELMREQGRAFEKVQLQLNELLVLDASRRRPNRPRINKSRPRSPQVGTSAAATASDSHLATCVTSCVMLARPESRSKSQEERDEMMAA